MTVAELIKLLKTMPQNSIVEVDNGRNVYQVTGIETFKGYYDKNGNYSTVLEVILD